MKSPNPYSVGKSKALPGSTVVTSWAGINWDHRWYLRKMTEAFCIFFFGDFVSQYYILYRFRKVYDARNRNTAGYSDIQTNFWREVNKDYSGIRSVRAGCFGFIVFAPFRIRFSRALEKFLPYTPFCTKTKKHLLPYSPENLPMLKQRLLLEYALWMPTIVGLNMSFSCFCDGRIGDIIPKVGLIYWPMLWQSYAIWIPVQLLCYGLVPMWLWTPMTNVTTSVAAGVMSYHNFRGQQLIMHGKILPPASLAKLP